MSVALLSSDFFIQFWHYNFTVIINY